MKFGDDFFCHMHTNRKCELSSQSCKQLVCKNHVHTMVDNANDGNSDLDSDFDDDKTGSVVGDDQKVHNAFCIHYRDDRNVHHYDHHNDRNGIRSV